MNSSHEKDLEPRTNHWAATRSRLLREAEAGQTSITELCRLRGISQNSFYKWRTQYGGMNGDEAKKLKALQAENANLKKLVADLSLDRLALEEVLAKKW